MKKVLLLLGAFIAPFATVLLTENIAVRTLVLVAAFGVAIGVAVGVINGLYDQQIDDDKE